MNSISGYMPQFLRELQELFLKAQLIIQFTLIGPSPSKQIIVILIAILKTHLFCLLLSSYTAEEFRYVYITHIHNWVRERVAVSPSIGKWRIATCQYRQLHHWRSMNSFRACVIRSPAISSNPYQSSSQLNLRQLYQFIYTAQLIISVEQHRIIIEE